LIRLAVRAPAAAAEQVLAAILELAPGGVEQVDGDGYVEFALYGAPGELPTLSEGEAEIAGVTVSVRGSEVPDDWAERWRRFHRPVLVAGRLYVRPPWERPAVRPGVEEVVIDPGQAFGTGSHPTTEGCLELLVGLAAERRRGAGRGSLADLGCGSGVLAIAAAKLGFGPITAVDADLAALEATERNARANGVSLARVERVNLRDDALDAPGRRRAPPPPPPPPAGCRDRRRQPDASAAPASCAARPRGRARPRDRLRAARSRGG
jgi:ribosomal protein L11 methyltransferase